MFYILPWHYVPIPEFVSKKLRKAYVQIISVFVDMNTSTNCLKKMNFHLQIKNLLWKMATKH